ncbi:hypothetical protein Ancab_013871 [Ancistrocladus abbreviatus]
MAGLQYYFFPTDFFVPPLYPDPDTAAPNGNQQLRLPPKTTKTTSSAKIDRDNGRLQLVMINDGEGETSINGLKCSRIVKAAPKSMQAIVPAHRRLSKINISDS